MNLYDPNRETLALAALQLESFLDDVVFTGGSIVGLFVTEPVVGRLRITQDVDVIVEVAGRLGFQQLESRLRKAGLEPDTSEGAPICRWKKNGVIIDVMPTDERILGFSNRWYPLAVNTANRCALNSDLSIRLVAPACFLATKIEAFLDRGNGDYLASHDLEDIVTVVGGRAGIVAEVAQSPGELRNYLRAGFKNMRRSTEFHVAAEGILAPNDFDRARFDDFLARVDSFVE